MQNIILVLHVIIAIFLIGLVLIQQGKGAEAGAGFAGGGGAQSLFGSQGSGSFLTRITTFLAVAFFVTSLGLAHLNSNRIVKEPLDIIDEVTAIETQDADVVGDTKLPVTDVPLEQSEIPKDS